MDSHPPALALAIPLAKPEIRPVDIAAIVEAAQTGKIAQGEITTRFEKACAAAIGVDGGVATHSGTSAIVLGLAALGVGRGHEVIVPSYTCLAVLDAVVETGARPILVDNENDAVGLNFNVRPRDVERAITSRTRAVIVPHMFGVAANVAEIRQLGVPLIEDITLSLGATTPDGRLVGSVGDLTICSFHASKMIACGEGGMLLGRYELLRRARELNGRESEQMVQRFEAPVRPYELHHGSRLSDLHAACGLAQLRRLGETIERRRTLASHYADSLRGLSGIVLPNTADSNKVFFRFIVQVMNRKVLDVLRDFCSVGIEAGRGVYPPLHRFLGSDNSDFPGAEAAAKANVSIPLYPALREEEVDHIIQSAKRILAKS
jgi:perosamine synthetase